MHFLTLSFSLFLSPPGPLPTQSFRHHVIAPVQSGLSTATDLLRRAASPELDLPAVEGNALWMLTTYLDDTIRISRDDAGSMFVMLRDV